MHPAGAVETALAPALAAARRDMAGVALSNAEAAVAPWEGGRPMLGTNPLAVANLPRVPYAYRKAGLA